MRTTIVCGMLGSGKTTFIRHLAANHNEKIVILVNDFGQAGIDGEVFSSDGIESVELPSGCVCCTLKFDLISSIEKIRETFSPDHLIIEPSGIASPSGVLDALDTLKVRPATVIGIVDASEFLDLNHEDAFGRFFQDQIINSDIVLVNKTDIADPGTVSGTIQAVEAINPDAIVLRSVNGITETVLPAVAETKKTSEVSPHLRFDSISLRLNDNIDHEQLSDFFQEMSMGRYGDVARAKALVNTNQGPYKFDLSFMNIRSIPFEKKIASGRLVIIGRSIRREEIAKIFPSPFALI